VEHEGVGIRTQLSDDEWNALRHEPGNEGDVGGHPVDDHYPCPSPLVEIGSAGVLATTASRSFQLFGAWTLPASGDAVAACFAIAHRTRVSLI
jgi:hypothetical protein